MAVIGIDSHKDTLVGCLIDADERVVEHRDVLWVPETRPWSLTCRYAGRC